MFSIINRTQVLIPSLLSKTNNKCIYYANNNNTIIMKQKLTSILCNVTTKACTNVSLSSQQQCNNKNVVRNNDTNNADKVIMEMSNETKKLAHSILSSASNDSRIALSRAITLIESKSYKHQIQAELLLNYLLNYNHDNDHDDTINNANKNKNDCFRIGFAGPPGAGKSTLIEILGKYILNLNNNNLSNDNNNNNNEENKLAVLCIDPSSSVSGGSILGDKTRMTELSKHPEAYIRPSPTSGTLGGLALRTNDVVTLLSSSNIFNYCFIETVGVGQSEIEIDQVVDLLVLVIPPAGGDELQGVKKGIVELTDLFIINKADGELEKSAKITASEYKNALHLLNRTSNSTTSSNKPNVLLVSAQTSKNIKELWDTIITYQNHKVQSGSIHEKRQKQRKYWMWKQIQHLIIERTSTVTSDSDSGSDGNRNDKRQHINDLLINGNICSRAAARQLLDCVM